MKIKVDATLPIEKYYLVDLKDNKINFTFDEQFDLQDGWYNLTLEYTGKKIDIKDVLVNDASVGHFLHTGFFTELSTGKRFQPANAMWTEGKYTIWIHTQLGHMIQSLCETVRNGDYGKNLFEKYLLTVDKSIEMDPLWPEEIKSYFRHANGPRWWRKNTLQCPYEVCEEGLLKDIDKEKLINYLPFDCPTELNYDELGKGDASGHMSGIAIRKTSVYPFIDIDSFKGEEIKKLCKVLGFKKILNVTLQTMPPKVAFYPHIDDHYTRDCKEHIEGPAVFLWNLSDKQEGHYFKLGPAGLVPLQNGVFFNQFYFSHGTFNDSNVARPLLIIHGDRGQTYE